MGYMIFHDLTCNYTPGPKYPNVFDQVFALRGFSAEVTPHAGHFDHLALSPQGPWLGAGAFGPSADKWKAWQKSLNGGLGLWGLRG